MIGPIERGKKPQRQHHQKERLSLYPLPFEEAVADLLRVPPPPKDERTVPEPPREKRPRRRKATETQKEGPGQ